MSALQKLSLLLLPLALLLTGFTSGPDWKLDIDKNGIKVFTKKPEGSKLLMTKVVMDLNMKVDQVEKIIMDVTNHKNWMNTVVTSEILKNPGQKGMVTYYVSDVPWPVSDRDIVLKWDRYMEDKTLVIKSSKISGEKPKEKGLVRIPEYENIYYISPNPDGGCHFVYTAAADPGGSIPNWLSNMFITEVPFKTWTKFKEDFEK